ncbi:hypothetical protein OsI_10632 [Oryza sativa Indica Group]|uniref:Uncharacterized protein n=1 Tax=Oryza sativa subsp. indica TaxID=39946 RepID=B8AJM1_ORYSI|nr:hypothetical protein OsI_10632 [Oryza sativa Indica Group]
MDEFVLTISTVWGRSSSAAPGSERSSGGGARGGGSGCRQAAVVDETEAAAGAEARRLLDLRGAPAVLAEVAALVVAALAEVAALMEPAAGAVARRLPDLRGVAAVLAEVAVLADKRRRSWRRRWSWRRRRRRRSWTRGGGGGRGRGGGAQGGDDARRRAAELAEVADGAVTPFARPRWDEFVHQFFRDQLVPDLRGIFLSRDQPIPPTPKPNTSKTNKEFEIYVGLEELKRCVVLVWAAASDPMAHGISDLTKPPH